MGTLKQTARNLWRGILSEKEASTPIGLFDVGHPMLSRWTPRKLEEETDAGVESLPEDFDGLSTPKSSVPGLGRPCVASH